MHIFPRHGRALWLAALLAAWACASSARMANAQELELPVPRAIVYPGDVISDEILVGRAFIAHTVARSTIYEVREALVGKVARRTLLPGQPIPVSAIRDPYLVTQGKTATVVFEHGGLVITTSALALQNGGVGDVVSLRNLDSGSVIKGIVASDGSIRLDAP
jgi:flagellar basal body P-ring formation protein FlgA